MNIAEQYGQHVVAQHSLSKELSAQIDQFIFDYFAVTLAGKDLPSSVVAREAFPTSTAKDNGRMSKIHGVDLWASMEDAALINGIVSHGPELDDTHEEASLHPAVVIMPAVFAYADAHEVDLSLARRAIAVGYDVMTSLGVLVGASESYGRGFHPTGICGSVGAAASIAVLMGLDADKATHAVSLAANMSAGSLEFLSDGSWTKRLNPGHAAATGIRAAFLARAGFEGPDTPFEGRDGFLRQYGEQSSLHRELNLEFGKGVFDTSIKMYPCCRYMHGNIDLLRELHQELPGLSMNDVESIECAVISAGATLVSIPAERKLQVNSQVDAQFNMPFGAALALTTGHARIDDFINAPALAEKLMPLIEKVTCYESQRLEEAYPASWQAEVRVRLTDGTTYEKYSEAYLGSPGNRASTDEILAKAQALAGTNLANQLSETVSQFTEQARLTSEMVDPTHSGN